MTWDSADSPPPFRPRPAQVPRILWRGALVATVVFGGLALMLVLRLIEYPLFRASRPVTPFLTQGVCRLTLRIIGLRQVVHGRPMRGTGAMVCNHVSWLDIFVLNARTNLYFVAKSEVAGWPGIGWLARATGTLFINRDRREARAQTDVFVRRLRNGHRLLFFPEGTSTDGLRVLHFKTTLFASFFNSDDNEGTRVQPVTIFYRAPEGEDRRFYGWWGDMDFADHLLKVLAARRQGWVSVTYHDPVQTTDFPDRKALAATLERSVRTAHDLALRESS